jgi:hypothetical protein
MEAEKCRRKQFDRADTVRDVRFPDLPGAGDLQPGKSAPRITSEQGTTGRQVVPETEPEEDVARQLIAWYKPAKVVPLGQSLANQFADVVWKGDLWSCGGVEFSC